MYLWQFDNDKPIYKQLVEKLEIWVINGTYPLGSKLPSVRELAEESGVNPNTMQRALQELETKGFVHTKRTSGRFVTEDQKKIEEGKSVLAHERIHTFLTEMNEIGIPLKQVINYIRKEEKK